MIDFLFHDSITDQVNHQRNHRSDHVYYYFHSHDKLLSVITRSNVVVHTNEPQSAILVSLTSSVLSKRKQIRLFCEVQTRLSAGLRRPAESQCALPAVYMKPTSYLWAPHWRRRHVYSPANRL